METIHELLGYERIKIVQRRDMFSFTLDALLLADFARVKGENESVIDLGCGNAPIPLFLTLKTTGRIVGVELQEEAFRLARKSVAHNGFEDRITIINADIKDVHKTLGHNVFDIAVANPPYFRYSPESNLNKNDYLSVARHEIAITLEDIVTAAKRLLREGGSLNMIHRTERLGELVAALRRHNFGLWRLRFVYPKTDSPAALLFLAEARANRKDDVVVEQPLYVYDDDGGYTEKVLKIFNFKK